MATVYRKPRGQQDQDVGAVGDAPGKPEEKPNPIPVLPPDANKAPPPDQMIDRTLRARRSLAGPAGDLLLDGETPVADAASFIDRATRRLVALENVGSPEHFEAAVQALDETIDIAFLFSLSAAEIKALRARITDLSRSWSDHRSIARVAERPWPASKETREAEKVVANAREPEFAGHRPLRFLRAGGQPPKIDFAHVWDILARIPLDSVRDHTSVLAALDLRMEDLRPWQFANILGETLRILPARMEAESGAQRARELINALLASAAEFAQDMPWEDIKIIRQGVVSSGVDASLSQAEEYSRAMEYSMKNGWSNARGPGVVLERVLGKERTERAFEAHQAQSSPGALERSGKLRHRVARFLRWL